MLKKTQNFAETTATMTQNDAFSDSLRSMRVRGTLLLRDVYQPPWAISIPDASRVAELLDAPENATAVAFHLVERGRFELDVSPTQKATIESGELAICFGGRPHCMHEGGLKSAVPFESILADAPPFLSGERPTDGTQIVCGVFFLEDAHFNPLFSSLPDLMHVSIGKLGAPSKLRSVAELLSWELDHRRSGSEYVVERFRADETQICSTDFSI